MHHLPYPVREISIPALRICSTSNPYHDDEAGSLLRMYAEILRSESKDTLAKVKSSLQG